MPSDTVDPWPCPNLSPHPPGRTGAALTGLDWREEHPTRLRVVDHTCSCRVIVYELLSCGGRYMIRRTHQTDPPRTRYAGPWMRPVAERMWRLLLTGEAR